MDADRVRGVTVPEAELEWSFTRSGGPGGQHANTSDTRAVLRWDVGRSGALTDAQRRRVLRRLAPRLTEDGVLILAADTHRSQTRNRQEAVRRLRALLAAALAPPPPPRRPTRPSRSAVERRLASKRRRARHKALRRPPEA